MRMIFISKIIIIQSENMNSKVDFCAVTNDNAVPVGVADRAAQTVPKDILELRPSSINIDGFGIYTLRYFHKGVQFGPYEGKLTTVASTEGYSWKLIEGRLVDESDETVSNYLRYINCAKDVSQQNLAAFQCKGEIYFRTCRDVTKDEELLIYFDNTSKNFYYKPQEENSDKEIYNCHFCRFGFVTEEDRDTHQQFCRFGAVEADITNEKNCLHTRAASHPNKPLVLMKNSECDDCSNTTNKKISLKRPKRDLADGEMYKSGVKSHKHLFKCPDCDFETFFKSSVNRHRITKHEAKNLFKCVDCDFQTCAKSSLNRHKNVKHEQRNLCADCDFETFHKSYMTCHRKDKHERKKLLKCTYCDFETFIKCSLIRHKNAIHKRENVFKCSDCDFETFHRASFNRHKNIKHEQKNLFRCTDCDFETFDKSYMNNHRRVKHELKKLFKCTECDFETLIKSNLHSHKNAKHEQENVFKCADCNFETFHHSSLLRHRKRKHEGKKLFVC